MFSSNIEADIKTNRFFVGVMLISFITLLVSYSSEFIFQKIPCQLCKLERLPYFGMLIVGVAGLSMLEKKTPLFFLLGIFFVSLILSAYHHGVQQNIFKDFCKGSSVSTLEDYKAMLHSPTCSIIGFAIFGIPATVVNFFISLGLIFLARRRLKTYRKC